MSRPARWILGGTLAAALTASTRPNAATLATHEYIVVYIGVEGVDGAMAGLADSVRLAAARRITGPGQQLIIHGISLDPQVDAGVRDLARVGAFDEISVGGNWTNSAVVRYLGGDFGPAYPKAGVPQVIVLEREIDQQITSLHVSPERELARYVGTRDIWNWARQGAPLPK
jgi:hypothetical protein